MKLRKFAFIMSVVLVLTELSAYAGMAAEKAAEWDEIQEEAVIGEAPGSDTDGGERETDGLPETDELSETEETDADGEVIALEAEYRTQDEIREYVTEHPFSYPSASYETDPVITSPYSPGKLDLQVLQNAVTELNVFRYVAGVPDDVTLSDEYEETAQAAAMISAVYGTINHYPDRPSDMDEDLYNKAYSGCSGSNLAAGFYTLGSAVEDAWLGDSGVQGVGHRWWALHPGLYSTAFGWVQNMSSTYRNYYSMDVIHMNTTSTRMNGVVWPARNMPVEYFDSSKPWSVTISYPSYSNQQQNQPDAVVTLKRKSDGRTWTFSSDNQSDGKFEPALSNNTLVFYPSGITCNDGDEYEVKVENLTGGGSIEYTVDFFSLESSQGSGSSSSSSSSTSRDSRSSSTSRISSSSSSSRISSSSSSSKGGSSGSSSDSSKDSSSSTEKDDQSSSSDTEESVSGYKKITHKKGDTFIVGQKVLLSIPGINNKDVRIKGKNGTYSNGIISSAKKGTIKLEAPYEKNGKTKYRVVCVIKVEEPKLKKALSLKSGASKQLKLSGTKTPADRWISSKSSVAKVNGSGMVTAVNSGECVITAYIGSYRCECTVKVK